MNKTIKPLINGIVTENPTFVMMLGMCPTLAVTTSAINGLGMGLTTTAVLVMSNIVISLLRKLIPDKVRIPAFIVIIASFVTIVEMLLEAYVPTLYTALGIYIPLIVVNCIILGRAEAFASKNGFIASMFDGIGMGLGFTIGLTCIGMVRELVGSGFLFGIRILPQSYEPLTIFILAPGAFLVLSFLVALLNKIREKKDKPPITIGSCSLDCKNCGMDNCLSKNVSGSAEKKAEKAVRIKKKKEVPVTVTESETKEGEEKKDE
ncbi:MAG: electron transport complex subunit E [Lachnospiraceae bacterium]|nr:electron transport complex subunit E [Lachnospiraceae bacterium]